ncbi:MAG: hypothetical protein ACE5J9_05180 [Methanosarcinales archaeon]
MDKLPSTSGEHLELRKLLKTTGEYPEKPNKENFCSVYLITGEIIHGQIDSESEYPYIHVTTPEKIYFIHDNSIIKIEMPTDEHLDEYKKEIENMDKEENGSQGKEDTDKENKEPFRPELIFE